MTLPASLSSLTNRRLRTTQCTGREERETGNREGEGGSRGQANTGSVDSVIFHDDKLAGQEDRSSRRREANAQGAPTGAVAAAQVLAFPLTCSTDVSLFQFAVCVAAYHDSWRVTAVDALCATADHAHTLAVDEQQQQRQQAIANGWAEQVCL